MNSIVKLRIWVNLDIFHFRQGGHPQPSGSAAAGAGPHPGYVPSAKPHLPTPKDPNFSRPQQSETFKVTQEKKTKINPTSDHVRFISLS